MNFKLRVLLLILSLVGIVSPIFSQADCPVFTPPVYEKNEDLIITSYHAHIAKGDGVFFTWGEDMNWNGTDATSMTPITPTNGYNYTGDILMYTLSTNSDGQAFLLTTTGLWAWGSRLEVLGSPLATSNIFSSVTLPSGVSASDVLDIKANSDVLFLLTNNGEVWVAGLNVTQVAGDGSTTANSWHQVKEGTGSSALTGVVELTGNREVVYARKGDGTLWTWGRGVALAGGATALTKTYATQMNLSAIPSGVNIISIGTYMDNLSFSSGVLALGDNGKVYGVGYDGEGQLITNTGGWVSDWTVLKDASGSDITDIVFLTTSDNSEEYASAAIITTVSGSTNKLWTWGDSDTGGIGHGSGLISHPTVPSGFVSGTDNPVYTSLGGHATSFLNTANGGSICFVGHITNGSGAGLQNDPNNFDCFNANHPSWPEGVLLCGQNGPPVAEDDQATTTQNLATTIDVLNLGTPDSDPNSDPITITGIGSTVSLGNTSTAQGGTIAINNNGTPSDPSDDFVDYTPPSGFLGEDTFFYEISDDEGFTDVAEVTVTVVPPPAPPVAVDDATAGNPGTTITLDVLANDSDPNLDIDLASFTFQSSTTTPNGGVFSYNGDGTITFVADGSYIGTETIDYEICDETSPTPFCATATITIDLDLTDEFGCLPSEDYSILYTAYAQLVAADNDMNTPENAIGFQNNEGAEFNDNGDWIVLDLGEIVPENDTIFIYLGKKSGQTGVADITTSDVNNGFGDALQHTISSDINNYEEVAYIVTNTDGVRYVRVERNSSSSDRIYLDGLRFDHRECKGGCTSPEVLFSSDGNADVTSGDAQNPNNALGEPDNSGAEIDGKTLILDLTDNIGIGDFIIIYAAQDGSATNFDVAGSDTNGSFTGTETFTVNVERNNYAHFIYEVTQNAGVRYLRIDGTSDKIFVDAVSYIAFECADVSPVAVNDGLSLCQNFDAVVNVQGNDSDPRGTALTTSIITAPTNGTATVDGNGAIAYSPNIEYIGTETITYQVCNIYNVCATADLVIDVLDNGCAAGEQSVGIQGNVTINLSATADDFLDENNNGRNNGTCDEFEIKTKSANLRRGLLKFDVSSIPATAAITSATLRLRETGGDEEDLVINIHQVLTDWSEGSECNGNGFPNWDNVSSGNPWTSSGGHYSATIIDGQTISTKNQFYDWDLKTLVEAWLGGTNNYGLILKYEDATEGAIDKSNVFALREHGTSSYRPQLIIEYTDYSCSPGCEPIPNQKPVAIDDAETTAEDTQVSIDVLDQETADNDFENNGLTISSAGSNPNSPTGNGSTQGGTLVINNNGTPGDVTDDFIDYTPALNYSGLDTFYYEITDAGGLKDTAEVIVTVTPVNDPPTAIDDAYTSAEDTPIHMNILDLGVPDSDPESNILITTVGSSYDLPIDFNSTQFGSLLIHENGTAQDSTDDFIIYIPLENYVGNDTFYYVIADAEGLKDTAKVVITITEVNDPPVAFNDVTNGIKDAITSIDVMNLGDPDYDLESVITLSATGSTSGSPNGATEEGGTVAINNGKIDYTPPSGFVGTDIFYYVISDAMGLLDTAQVSITVNGPPVADNDEKLNQPLGNVSINVLTNDILEDSLEPTPSEVTVDLDLTTAGVQTSLIVSNEGTWTYSSGTGNLEFSPSDSLNGNPTDITYELTEIATGLTDQATVNIEFINSTEATNDYTNTPFNTPVTSSVLINDRDIEGNSQDVTTLEVDSDGDGIPETAKSLGVFNTVGGVNSSGTTNNNAGTLKQNANGSYTFIPTNGFAGKVTYKYTVCDDVTPEACQTALSIIDVLKESNTSNTDVTASPDAYFTEEDITVTSTVFSNDNDPEGGTFDVTSAKIDTNGDGVPNSNLTIGIATTIAGIDENNNPVLNAGSLEINMDGTFIFIPTTGFTGTVSAEYEITDSDGDTDVAPLVIEIIPDANNELFATDDSALTDAQTPVSGNLITNDVDPEGDNFTVTGLNIDTDGDGLADTDESAKIDGTTSVLVAGTDKNGAPVANAGSLIIDADGSYTFTPSAGFFGNVNVCYTICDSPAAAPTPPVACDPATLEISVLEVYRDYGDAPVVYPKVWHRAMVDVDSNNEFDGSNDVWLGSKSSFEESQSFDSSADGDTFDDAITFGSASGNFPTSILPSTNYNVDVTVNSAMANTVFYGMWIDWDEDGTYDDFYNGSQVTASPAIKTVSITSPATYSGETVNVRLRVDDSALASGDFTGGKTNGEVEDFQAFVALPVELNSFKAREIDCDVQLTWETQSEEKFDYFEVQWSGDGHDFKSLEIVRGKGGITGQVYSIMDKRAAEVNYYRLKMVDLDGSLDYSKVISIDTDCSNGNDGLNIYPNPILRNQGTLNVKFYTKKNETQLMIVDVLGRTVKRISFDVEPGMTNSIQIDISNLPSGTYSLQQEGTKKSNLFIIQE